MRKQKGLTLIELLITVAIIGIIAAIAIPSVLKSRFRAVNEPLSSHLEVALNEKAVDVSRPIEEWLPADEKAVLRPFVAKRLKDVCENAASELAGWQKVREELFSAPVDDQHVGLDRRLEILAVVRKNIAYFSAAANDSGKSCAEARDIAKKLDLLPAEAQP